MRACLTSPEGGYYTSRRSEGGDQFGKKGDFVTSPEISQIFGELLGVWVYAEWLAQGRRKEGVQIMEFGPGRGTLMDDMLRTIRHFKPFAESIEAIYLLEAGPTLREAQKTVLCGDSPVEETEVGHRSRSKYLPNVPVIWVEDITFVPQDNSKTPFIIAHEFFDALPIHAFQSIPPAQPQSTILTPTGTLALNQAQRPSRESQQNSWREFLVSPTPPGSTHSTLSTPHSQRSNQPSPPEFELSLAKASTPHSLYLPNLSPRYKTLLQRPNSMIEISPEGLKHAATIATLIGGAPKTPKREPSGAALILDYGPSDTVPVNSLRGIKEHRLVSALSEPGRVDLSADVDFLGLAESAIGASERVEVHGPVEQSVFLKAMGGEERVGQLLGKTGGDGRHGAYEEKKRRIESGWKRLVDRGPNGMGKLYKAMAITPYRQGLQRRPVGFGGM